MITTQAHKRFQTIFGIGCVLTGIVIFLICVFYNEVSYFLNPTQALSFQTKTKKIRIGGRVELASYTLKGTSHLFRVADQQTSIRVIYDGWLPPLFKENQGIVVEGSFRPHDTVFYADKVFAKHDEYYQPKE